jgi:hypothetical protein
VRIVCNIIHSQSANRFDDVEPLSTRARATTRSLFYNRRRPSTSTSAGESQMHCQSQQLDRRHYSNALQLMKSPIGSNEEQLAWLLGMPRRWLIVAGG